MVGNQIDSTSHLRVSQTKLKRCSRYAFHRGVHALNSSLIFDSLLMATFLLKVRRGKTARGFEPAAMASENVHFGSFLENPDQ